MTLQINSTLQGGKYRILSVLGQGGFGITYLAEQTMLGRKVAIKEFFMKEFCNRGESTSHVTIGTEGSRETVNRFRDKFIKEAKNIAKLDHPNIVDVLDVFEENDTAYYVMKYFDGGSLAFKVKTEGSLPESVATRYILKVADALNYIHQHKMNHLDVKPANIILNDKDEPVLIDFGLSKQYDALTGNQTSTTPVCISHGYAPMEQYKQNGVKEFSPQTDIYALGATFYTLLSGQTPPDAQDLLEEDLPDFKCSPHIKDAIAKAMQPKRSARPKSIEEWVSLIKANNTIKNNGQDANPVLEEETVLVGPSNSDKIQVAVERTSGFTNGHEWIDLGLPSGRKWASCNIGAVRSEEYGFFFAWGEKERKGLFEWTNYTDSENGSNQKFHKYFNERGLDAIEITSEDDAAYSNWQKPWHLPTPADFEELLHYCDWQWTTKNSVKGYLIVSKENMNSIFLPAAGWHRHISVKFRNSYGHYWTSNLSKKDGYSQTAFFLYFHSKSIEISTEARFIGFSIRPVI